jgi:hypothetical protein
MATTDTGVYLQFFDDGESLDKELPPLGPFELLIIRHNRIIGDREQVEHDLMGLGAVERWLEAELELRRALGDEPGGVRRSHMRIRAPQGDIIVRFYDYTGDEAPKVPELGPFYALTIGKREVRADDQLLAIRATDLAPWTLTDAVRPGVSGINKSDFSVFSLSAREPRAAPPPPVPPLSMREAASPSLATAPPAAGPPALVAPPPGGPPYAGPQPSFIERRKVQREVYVARPEQEEPSLTPADVSLIMEVDKLKQQDLAEQLMVERLRRAQHASPELALHSQPAPADLAMRFQPPVREREVARAAAAEVAEDEDDPFGSRVLRFLWSARLVLVTLLLLASLASAYGYLRPTSAGNVAAPALTIAAVGSKVESADWTYTVNSVGRPQRLGPTLPTTGGYLVVNITVSRKNPDAAPLSTGDFQLIDVNGGQSFPFAPSSDVYGVGLGWATKYPLNASVHNNLVFDVNPKAKNLLVFIKDANAEVRLPDP